MYIYIYNPHLASPFLRMRQALTAPPAEAKS